MNVRNIGVREIQRLADHGRRMYRNETTKLQWHIRGRQGTAVTSQRLHDKNNKTPNFRCSLLFAVPTLCSMHSWQSWQSWQRILLSAVSVREKVRGMCREPRQQEGGRTWRAKVLVGGRQTT